MKILKNFIYIDNMKSNVKKLIKEALIQEKLSDYFQKLISSPVNNYLKYFKNKQILDKLKEINVSEIIKNNFSVFSKALSQLNKLDDAELREIISGFQDADILEKDPSLIKGLQEGFGSKALAVTIIFVVLIVFVLGLIPSDVIQNAIDTYSNQLPVLSDLKQIANGLDVIKEEVNTDIDKKIADNTVKIGELKQKIADPQEKIDNYKKEILKLQEPIDRLKTEITKLELENQKLNKSKKPSEDETGKV